MNIATRLQTLLSGGVKSRKDGPELQGAESTKLFLNNQKQWLEATLHRIPNGSTEDQFIIMTVHVAGSRHALPTNMWMPRLQLNG